MKNVTLLHLTSCLQVEVTSLREENMRLLEVVRGQKGPTVAEHLMPSLSHTLTTLSLSSPSTSSPLTSEYESCIHGQNIETHNFLVINRLIYFRYGKKWIKK